MRSVLKSKKGQTMNIVTGTVLALMVFIFMVFAVLFGISALNPSAFFTVGSASANATQKLIDNTTTGISNFSEYLPKVFLVLAVVLVLSAIVLLILYVRRMQGGQSGGL